MTAESPRRSNDLAEPVLKTAVNSDILFTDRMKGTRYMKLSKYSYLIMLGHVCADMTQGALPAILPFLVSSGSISYTSASGLVFAVSAVSSLVQPVFGYLGDRTSRQWLMSLGVFLSGVGLAIMGLMDSYWKMFAIVAISGVGVALFHPEGGKCANYVAGENKGAGMGLFGAGGSIGFAIGPMLASFAMVTFGIEGTVIFAFPAAIVSIMLLLSLKGLKSYIADGHDEKPRQVTALENDWPSFFRAVTIVFVRSIMNYGLVVFIPLYWVGVLGQSEASGGLRLTILAAFGIIATLAGGKFADKYGYVKLIRIANFAMLPFLIMLLMVDDPTIATLLIIPLAFCNSGPYSAMIAHSQSFLPKSMGLASGITLGLSVSVGGMVSPLIGYAADTFGLSSAMYAIVAVAFLGIIFSLIIPKQRDFTKGR